MYQIEQQGHTDDESSNPYAGIEEDLRRKRNAYALKNPPCGDDYPDVECCECVSCQDYRGLWGRGATCGGPFCGCPWCVVDADIQDEIDCARFEEKYNAGLCKHPADCT